MPIQGFLEDYVFTIQALFDLYEASLDQGWLQWALQLQHMQDKLFWDPRGFAYFSTEAGDSSLLLRLKDGELGDMRYGVGSLGRAGVMPGWRTKPWHAEADGGALFPADQDGAEPCANSVAVTNLLRAACYSSRMEWVDKAGQILAAFSERLRKMPITLPEMARATSVFHHTPKQVQVGAYISLMGIATKEGAWWLCGCSHSALLSSSCHPHSPCTGHYLWGPPRRRHERDAALCPVCLQSKQGRSASAAIPTQSSVQLLPTTCIAGTFTFSLSAAVACILFLCPASLSIFLSAADRAPAPLWHSASSPAHGASAVVTAAAANC